VRVSWNSLQRAYVADPSEHLIGAEALGLHCPQDVFEQLFQEQHDSKPLASLLRFVDWADVRWEEGDLSGVALRQVGVPREFEHAVDEARARTAQNGFFDERSEVMAHWEEERTWIRSPIVLAGEVLQSALSYELIVGFTRLGNLLGALDRRDIPEAALHRVWIGRAS
jgi:hypothetical protein